MKTITLENGTKVTISDEEVMQVSKEERLRKQLKAISELLKQTHMSDIDRAKFIAILEEV